MAWRHWGLEVISTILDLRALDGCEWSGLCPGRFIPGERAPSIHLIGGWVDPRAGIVTVEKRTFVPLLGIEPQMYSMYQVSYPNCCIIQNIFVLQSFRVNEEKTHSWYFKLKEGETPTLGRIWEIIWYFKVVNYPYEIVTEVSCVICCSPSTSVISSVGMVPLEDLYQLNQYLQVRRSPSTLAFKDSAACRTLLIILVFYYGSIYLMKQS
jgi:hypothetical protein